MDALSETAYHSYDKRELEAIQHVEGRMREAFGGAYDSQNYEPQTTEFDDSTAIYQGIPVEVVDPLPELIDFSEIDLNSAGTLDRFLARVNTVTFEDVAMEVYDEAFNLLVERQKKYGPKNVEQQGLYGLLVRMRDDKINRIQRALSGRIVNGQIVLDDIDLGGEEGDTLEDAYLDVANYAVISLILLRGLWGKPLAGDVGIDQ